MVPPAAFCGLLLFVQRRTFAAMATLLLAVILARIQEYGPAELADIARVYSRCGLNPTAEAGEAAAASLDLSSSSDEAAEVAAGLELQPDAAGDSCNDSSGSTASLFDALARQTVARIQGADLQDILR